MKYDEPLLGKKFPIGQGLNHGDLSIHLPSLTFPLLKGKLRHIEFLGVWIKIYLNQAAPNKLEVVRIVPPAGPGKDFVDKMWKQSKEMIGLAIT